MPIFVELDNIIKKNNLMIKAKIKIMMTAGKIYLLINMEIKISPGETVGGITGIHFIFTRMKKKINKIKLTQNNTNVNII